MSDRTPTVFTEISPIKLVCSYLLEKSTIYSTISRQLLLSIFPPVLIKRSNRRSDRRKADGPFNMGNNANDFQYSSSRRFLRIE